MVSSKGWIGGRKKFAAVKNSTMRSNPQIPGSVFTCCLIFLFLLYPTHAVSAGSALTVFFDTGSAEIAKEYFPQIQRVLNNYSPVGEEKILVIGYSDPSGSEGINLALSRRRATNLSVQILRSARLKPQWIRAIGLGTALPVGTAFPGDPAGNRRRAEVYLQGIEVDGLEPSPWLKQHNRPYILAALSRVREQVFENRFHQALSFLKSAETLGGREYSDWYLAYGAIGFFSGRPPDELLPLFEEALHLDPYNEKAREFIGRLRARKGFAGGTIGPDMGRSAEFPIPVGSASEMHELLRLFKVTPLRHFTLTSGAIEGWECTTDEGREVIYYFDGSSLCRWAYLDHLQPGHSPFASK